MRFTAASAATQIGPIPLSAWTSLWSIDAVLVAIVWQALFARHFINRWPRWPETIALGATVWLIYVADRLLDASRLDLGRPHTLRHRFYHHHAGVFRLAWIGVLVAAVAVVVTSLPVATIRSGLILAAMVMVYGVGVHFIPQVALRRSIGVRIPKEIQVGVLFAAGTTLICWSEMPDIVSVIGLLAATALAAVWFSVNCFLISRWESDLDLAQSFTSESGNGHDNTIRWLMTCGSIALPVLGLAGGWSLSIWIGFVGSASGLVVLENCYPDAWFFDRANSRSVFDVRGVIVDAMLWFPPMVALLVGVLVLSLIPA